MRALCVALAVLAVATIASADPAPPTFPDGFSCYEVDQLLQFQGDYSTNGGNICCPLDSAACQVEVQGQSGLNSFDYVGNRTRWDDDSGQIIIDNFATQMEMLVVANGSSWACQAYCSLEGESLDPFGLGDNSSYIGQKVVNGETCDDWEWKETILGVITMEISDMFVTTDSSGNSIPVQEIDQLTPFGQAIGTMTSSWSKWNPVTPDPSLFDVTGVIGCPMGSNCGDDARQLKRLRNKQFKTWGKYKSMKGGL